MATCEGSLSRGDGDGKEIVMMEVEGFQAGCELDAMVAERVFRLRNVQYEGGEAYCITPHPDEYGFHLGFHLIKRIGEDETVSYVPRYSTDIAAAWCVVERIYATMPNGSVTGKTFYLNCSEPTEHKPDRWCAAFEIDESADAGYYEATADTPSLAICRAALALTATKGQADTGGEE